MGLNEGDVHVGVLESEGPLSNEAVGQHAGYQQTNRRQGLSRQRALLAITFGFLAIIIVAIIARKPNLTQTSQYETTFFVIGDWGREGNKNQSKVASSMAIVAESLKPMFIISTGDNFYPGGLNQEKDPLFNKSFVEVYSHDSLKSVPWHSVLGNHDYGDGHQGQYTPAEECGADVLDSDGKLSFEKPSAVRTASMVKEQLGKCKGTCCYSPYWQLNQQGKQLDQRWNQKRQYTLTDNQNYQFVFFDSTPLLKDYYSTPFAYNPGGIMDTDVEKSWKWIEDTLSSTKTPWKIAAGHHPIRSNSLEHGDTPELVSELLPLLNKHQVQIYLSGHDHDLQIIKNDDEVPYYLVSGAGSDCRLEDWDDGNRTGQVFGYGKPGFMAIQLTPENAIVQAYGEDPAKPLKQITIPISSA